MADNLLANRYTLTAVVYKRKAVDINGAVIAARVGIIYKDPPSFVAQRYTVTAVIARSKATELNAAVYQTRVGIIYPDPPSFASYRLSLKAVIARARAFDLNGSVSAMRLGFIIRGANGVVYSQRTAFIIKQAPVLSPAFVKEVSNVVIQHSDVKTMANTISPENVVQVRNITIQKADDMPFLWSFTRVAQESLQVVQRTEYVAQSLTRAAQVRNQIVQQFSFTIPEDVWSASATAQVYMLVCQSLDIPYEPVSGVYGKQARLLCVQQVTDLMMWTSPAIVPQVTLRVTQKRTAEPFPRSLTSLRQYRSQVTQSRTPEPFPVSNDYVAQALSQATQATVMPDPHGPDIVGQVGSQVTQASVMSAPVGRINVGQETTIVTQARNAEALPISYERLTQLVSAVTGKADYQSPSAVLARTRAGQVRSLVAQATYDYPPVSTPSTTTVAQAVSQIVQMADPARYPSPDSIYQASKYTLLPQLRELATQSLPMDMPISVVRIRQLETLTTAHIDMPTPAEMAASGVFISQLIGSAAYTVDYPSTDAPASVLAVSQVVRHLAVSADYPDAQLPTNFAVADQLIEHAAVTSEYPDPASLGRPLIVSHISEQLAAISGYPEPDTLHSPLNVLQVAWQLSVPAIYPDKGAILSFARVSQLSQQAAFKATYPNKDLPQSNLWVNQVRHHVARRDLTMYALPEPPRRHRVRIVCQFVY